MAGVLRFPRRQSRFSLFGQTFKASGISDRQLRQNLAVQFHPGLLKPADELAVAEPVQLGGGADAHNPQRTELALLEPAPGVRELQPALHRLFGGTVQLGFSQEIAAGALQYLFALGAAFGSAFDTRHGVLLFFWRSMQDRNSAAGGKEKIRSLF